MHATAAPGASASQPAHAGLYPRRLREPHTDPVASDSFADQEAERLRAALESVRHDLRGLPHASAIERLKDALRRHDVFLSEDTVSRLATLMSDPWWPVRHPLSALSTVLRRRTTVDVESMRYARQAEQLSTRLDHLLELETLESFSISSRRTIDGMTHVVAIRPWSDRAAERIRAAAAPIPSRCNGSGNDHSCRDPLGHRWGPLIDGGVNRRPGVDQSPTIRG